MPRLRKKPPRDPLAESPAAAEGKARRRSQPRSSLTGEARARWLRRHADYQRERRARLPPERLDELRRANAARNRRRRAGMTAEELDRLRKENRERARRRRAAAAAAAVDVSDDVMAPRDLFSSVGLQRQALTGDALPKRRGRPLTEPEMVDPDSLLLSSVSVELTEGAEEVRLGPVDEVKQEPVETGDPLTDA